MVLTKVEQLIEKYENGETTLQEEQQLKDYFSQETVAPHLEMYKPIFCYFLVNQQEQYTKQLPLNSNSGFIHIQHFCYFAIIILLDIS